jgi:hypothetical protein
MLLTATGILAQEKDPANLTGPYLGQSPPGMTPEVFAPGILSNGIGVASIAFTPDGKEVYFARHTTRANDLGEIMVMKFEKDGWTAPELAPFSGVYRDWNLNLSPDGTKLFYTSRRPLRIEELPKKDNDIWFVEKTENGWCEPINPGYPVNTKKMDCYASVTNNGTLYYHGFNYPESKGGADIYRSNFINGKYLKPENLGKAINSKYNDYDAFIAPDESFVIFVSHGRPEGFGSNDLYISFRSNDGYWNKAINMGNEINSEASEICPSLSIDKQYLFFSSNRNVSMDVYWVDAKIIDELR